MSENEPHEGPQSGADGPGGNGDDVLEALFAVARARDVTPSDSLLAAIERQALVMQTDPMSEFSMPDIRARRTGAGMRASPRGLARGLPRGWAGAGALAACLVLGLALGFLAPPPIGDMPVLRSDLTRGPTHDDGAAGAAMVETGLAPLDDLMAEG